MNETDHARPATLVPDAALPPPPAGQLLPAALGSSSSRHLFIADDDKLLVLADSITLDQAQAMQRVLGGFLGIDPERISVLPGARDLITTSSLQISVLEEDDG